MILYDVSPKFFNMHVEIIEQCMTCKYKDVVIDISIVLKQWLYDNKCTYYFKLCDHETTSVWSRNLTLIFPDKNKQLLFKMVWA